MTRIKRRAALAALFGFGAAAQTVTQTEKRLHGDCNSNPELCQPGRGYDTLKLYAPAIGQTPYLTVQENGNAFLGKSKPKNNECPVCGTMAEPDKRAPIGYEHGRGYPDGTISLGTPIYDTKPQMNCTRCKNCNCAFWQDLV